MTGVQNGVPESPYEELVTVVVPARNEQSAIAGCLASIRGQDWQNLQIIVVDGASTDATVEVVEGIAEEDPRVEVISNPRGLIPISLNLALEQAKGRFLVRVDAHARVPADYVRIAAGHLDSGRWGGVGGRKDGVGLTSAGRAIAAAMASPFGVGNSTYHYGTQQQTVEHIPFGAYPVALARELGGWDEQMRVNQDFEFDYRIRRAGHELLFDPALRIDWESRQTIRALYDQYYRYGRGKVKVAAKHPKSVRYRHLASPALVAWTGLAAVTTLRGGRRTGPLMMAPYAAGVGAATIHAAKSLDRKSDALGIPLAFLAMHYGWGLGFWRGVGDVANQRLGGSR